MHILLQPHCRIAGTHIVLILQDGAALMSAWGSRENMGQTHVKNEYLLYFLWQSVTAEYYKFGALLRSYSSMQDNVWAHAI